MSDALPYDAVLVVSFGGPEGPDEVMPFLENVLRGKNVPHERLLEVAEHYKQFGGVSPINAQCRELIAALETELAEQGPRLPIYWGNRNWRPMLDDTLAQMAADGVRRVIAYFTSAFSSYSGCRQYLENLDVAIQKVGASSLQIDKLRMPYNHPGFIAVNAERLREEIEAIPTERREQALVMFTAHSIPLAMAKNCAYEEQLTEACRLIAEGVGHTNWELVYQSRSGPPQQPWLEPDVCDQIKQRHSEATLTDVVIHPVGFVSDHLEVLYDLDTEARQVCEELGIGFRRAATIGNHPVWIRAIRDLIVERIATEQGKTVERPALGTFGPCHDVCAPDCCSYSPQRPSPQRPSDKKTNHG